MRIISGRARGAKLFSPEGMDTRPTLDRVREAVFSMIQARIDGACVLDLFSGSGAMGLEALSRGAAEADLVDISAKACQCIRKNVEKTRLEGARVTMSDFKDFLSRCSTGYDLIFLDPPYASGYYSTALDIIKERGLLKSDGMIIAECSDSEEFDCRGYEIYRRRMYGKAHIFLLCPSQ